MISMWMTFDLDGVVMENPFNFGVFPHVLQELTRHHLDTVEGIDKDREALREEIWQGIRTEYQRRFMSNAPYKAYNWDEIVAQFAEKYGYPDTFDIATLVRQYCHPPYIRSHDNADLILPQLRERGWKIGVITNGYSQYQIPVLEALNLLPHIEALVTPEKIQQVKPDRAIFEQIPGVNEGIWIHVGDTLVHDIFGARRAGAKTVWVYRNLSEELMKMNPLERARSPVGHELVKAIWEKERLRYQNLCEDWQECLPDYIVFNLSELLDLEKGVRKMKRLEDLTLQEKVGQLVMVGFVGTTEVPEGMQTLVRDYNLGGAIYFSRNVTSASQLANLSMDLQKLAKESSAGLPLFISIDQEGGIVSRLPGSATIFPGNMALGAMNDPQAVYEMAKVVARELKAVGVNINLAPVLDVNNNAANPVIGVRSYGENPDLVSKLGQAYIRGLQEEGVLACGKHFPGHGDTAFDSHLALASVPHAKERLYEVELKPFREAIAGGLASIMSAHVIFPAFEPDNVPGTLSKRVLTDLLRKELGFDGLLMTDCMEMQAISDNYSPAEAAVRAVEAGVDLVLVSHTFDKQLDSYNGILQAVQSGRISEERINESVTRILKWKEYLAWDQWQANEQEIAKVGSPEHRQLADTIGERVVTLVRDETKALPARPADYKKVLIIYPMVKMLTIVEEKDAGPRENLYRAFKDVYPSAQLHLITMNPDDSEIADVKKLAQRADLVIFSAFFASKNPAQAQLINDLAQSHDKLVVVAIRNPYDLQVLPAVETYLTTYDYNEYSLRGVARVIAGEVRARGVLPITIPGGAK